MMIRTFLGLAMAVACTAWAGDPIDPAALGNFDAMLATCRAVNPAGQAAYNTLRDAMVGEQPEGALEAAAQTPEYQKAYAETRKKAEAETSDSTRKSCAQLAASLGPRAHHVDKFYKGSKK